MCPEEPEVFTGGNQQHNIATPIPLPYNVRSNAVLRSMMRKELRDRKGAISDTLLITQFEHELDGRETSATSSRTQIQVEDTIDAQEDAMPTSSTYFKLPNPIEPLLLALLTPEMAEEYDSSFIPPSPYCRCRADSIQWSCQEEYTKNASLNAWGY